MLSSSSASILKRVELCCLHVSICCWSEVRRSQATERPDFIFKCLQQVIILVKPIDLEPGQVMRMNRSRSTHLDKVRVVIITVFCRVVYPQLSVEICFSWESTGSISATSASVTFCSLGCTSNSQGCRLLSCGVTYAYRSLSPKNFTWRALLFGWTTNNLVVQTLSGT